MYNDVYLCIVGKTRLSEESDRNEHLPSFVADFATLFRVSVYKLQKV